MKPYVISSELRVELSTLIAGAANESSIALERLIEKVSVLPPKAIFEVEDLVGRLPNALVVAAEQRAAWFRRVPGAGPCACVDDEQERLRAPSGVIGPNSIT
jgi:hypothetical protein